MLTYASQLVVYSSKNKVIHSLQQCALSKKYQLHTPIETAISSRNPSANTKIYTKKLEREIHNALWGKAGRPQKFRKLIPSTDNCSELNPLTMM